MSDPWPRLWVITEPYHPEEISTGYFLTGIAECLAGIRDVGVVCSMRVTAGAGHDLPRSERRHGVEIHRAGLRFGYPRNLLLRFFVEVWLAAAMWWRALWLVRRGDEMLVVTSPPLLPFLMRTVAWLRGARFDLLIHDVYPEVLTVTGVLHESGTLVRFAQMLTGKLYSGCRRILVLSPGMAMAVAAKLRGEDVPLHVVPNWGDTERIKPKPREEVALLRELGTGDRFVVQYSGNIGRTHGAEVFVDLAEKVQHAGEETFFLMVGAGSMKKHLQEEVARRGIDNICFLDRQPSEKFADSIAACDVAVIIQQEGMGSLSAPSRLYNLLAAGKPLLIIADADSEPARLVREHSLGWVVPAGDAQAAHRALETARASTSERGQMSQRARNIAEEQYSYAAICARLLEIYSPPAAGAAPGSSDA